MNFMDFHIDHHVILHPHANHVVKVRSKHVSIFSILKHQLNESSLLLTYNSLLYQIFKYCQSFWGLTIMTLLKKMFFLQKKNLSGW